MIEALLIFAWIVSGIVGWACVYLPGLKVVHVGDVLVIVLAGTAFGPVALLVGLAMLVSPIVIYRRKDFDER